jgi:hypothetical protein
VTGHGDEQPVPAILNRVEDGAQGALRRRTAGQPLHSDGDDQGLARDEAPRPPAADTLQIDPEDAPGGERLGPLDEKALTAVRRSVDHHQRRRGRTALHEGAHDPYGVGSGGPGQTGQNTHGRRRRRGMCSLGDHIHRPAERRFQLARKARLEPSLLQGPAHPKHAPAPGPLFYPRLVQPELSRPRANQLP